jgi:hypothetical protein
VKQFTQARQFVGAIADLGDDREKDFDKSRPTSAAYRRR